jgi:hypothetical protein
LRHFHEGFRLATLAQDELARAIMAGYLASSYLAWSDHHSAHVFTKIADQIYRDKKRHQDLSRMLRLRARIALMRNRMDEASRVIQEAWTLALDNNSIDSAANIAPVYADVTLQHDGAEAALKAIGVIRELMGERFPVGDRDSVDVIEALALIKAKRVEEARQAVDRLLQQFAFPTMQRAKALVASGLLAYAQPGASSAVMRQRYDVLMAEIRDIVRVVPDPELSLNVAELTRPLAEAAILRELQGCAPNEACGASALTIAGKFFALSRLPPAQPQKRDDAADLAVFRALSSLEARGRNMPGRALLLDEAKRAQTRLRLPNAATDDCAVCAKFNPAGRDLIFFLGDEHGWRWQRTSTGWVMRGAPGWGTLRPALDATDVTNMHAPEASRLVADLAHVPRASLAIGGDSRTVRIPWNALALVPGVRVVDRYAVRVLVDVAGQPVQGGKGVRFVSANPGAAPVDLPMANVERRHFMRWAKRWDFNIAERAVEAADPLRLLHVASHGQADFGHGVSVLWAGDQPTIGFANAPATIAQTVLLSACESAASSEDALDLSSVAVGYLRGGAREVVGTLRPVPDAVAARFTDELYRHLDGKQFDLAQAVRSAQTHDQRRSPMAPLWIVLSTR